MELTGRFVYAFTGAFLGAAIAMALMFWTGFDNSGLLFQVLIPVGALGGFFFGEPFHDFLSNLFTRIW